MNIKYNDEVISITKKIVAQVVEETDMLLKEAIINYAKQKYKGEEIEFYFIDKKVADEIIDLGLAEYTKRIKR